MNENINIDEHQSYPDSDQQIEVPTMKVIPLKKICMTIGELPTSYLETMTYYEMLVWFINYLRDNIIPTVNGNAEAVQEVQNVVMELQNYINNFKDSIDEDVEGLEDYMNNYFNNLDVQEEINNKLDEYLENGTLATLLAEFNANYITTSQLLMVENDETEAINNMTKLVTAINQGKYIIVDGKYYLDTTDSINITNKDLIITGLLNEEKGFIFNPASEKVIFHIDNCSNINIKHVSFDNVSANLIRLFYISGNDWYIENFKFNDNIVKNKINILYAHYDKTVNPTLYTNGFNTISIKNNKCYNLNQTRAFAIYNPIADYVEVKNNYIKNFTDVFFYYGIENDASYLSTIRDNILLVEIDDNTAICETTYNEISSSSYYCFVLVEGNKCYYRRNYVEGLKSTRADDSVYDAYLSVNILYSNNNITKNVLSFTTTLNTYVFESKEGKEGFERYYENNSYIIEEDWQKTIDENLVDSIGFIRVQGTASKYIINNCYINVPNFAGFPTSSANSVIIDKIYFTNNTLISKTSKSDNVRTLFNLKCSNSDSQVFIQNNIIQFEENAPSLLVIPAVDTNFYQLNKVFIENNEMTLGNIILSPRINYITILNNNIKLLGIGTGIISLFSTSASINNNIIYKNNNITSENSIYLMRFPGGHDIVDMENTFYTKIPDSANNGFHLRFNNELASVQRYYFEYEIIHSTGKQKLNFYVDYGYDENGNYLTYTNTSDQSVTVRAGGSGSGIKLNNETSITLSKVRVAVENTYFAIVPQFNYAISGKPYYVKQTVKEIIL